MARSRTPGIDYEVGYKRPPVHTRFKRGQSGNPKGRPKKVPEPALHAGLSEEDALTLRLLAEEVSVVVDGQARRMTRREAICRAQLEQAMAGDLRAMKYTHEQEARALAAKEAIDEVASADQARSINELMMAERLAKSDSPPAEPSGTALEAGGPAAGGAEMGEEFWGPGAGAEAGDPLADMMADEWALTAPTSAPSHPGQPPEATGGAPAPAQGSGMIFGNAPTQLQPPRVRQQRRASSSEPLIKSRHPLERYL